MESSWRDWCQLTVVGSDQVHERNVVFSDLLTHNSFSVRRFKGPVKIMGVEVYPESL